MQVTIEQIEETVRIARTDERKKTVRELAEKMASGKKLVIGGAIVLFPQNQPAERIEAAFLEILDDT